MANLIEFNNVDNYDIDIQPTGVFLTVRSSTPEGGYKVFQVKVQCAVKPGAPAAPRSSSTPSPARSTPQIIELKKKVETKPTSNSVKNFAHPTQKLTDKDVAEIKAIWPQMYEEYKTVNGACRALGELYGCSMSNIRAIIQNRSRVHVQPSQS